MQNFKVNLSGEIDLTRSEANATGLFIGEGNGEMTLVIQAGTEEEVKIKVHKLTFEGVVTQEE